LRYRGQGDHQCGFETAIAFTFGTQIFLPGDIDDVTMAEGKEILNVFFFDRNIIL